MLLQRHSKKFALVLLAAFLSLGFTCGNGLVHAQNPAPESVQQAHGEGHGDETLHHGTTYNDNTQHCCSIGPASDVNEKIIIPSASSSPAPLISALPIVFYQEQLAPAHPSTAPPLQYIAQQEPYSSASFLARLRSVKRQN